MVQHPQLRGLNVTLPHKEKICAFLHELSPHAAEIGAVNCIAIKDGRYTGYNTDWIGFLNSLLPLIRQPHQRALVLGNGGAAKAVHYALQVAGIPFQIVSRSPGAGVLSYAAVDKELLQTHRILVNTTPLGMAPHTDAAPSLPYHLLDPDHLLYDLVYTPAETRFLQQGKAAGATVKNGLEMLEIQALESWRIWQLSQQDFL